MYKLLGYQDFTFYYHEINKVKPFSIEVDYPKSAYVNIYAVGDLNGGYDGDEAVYVTVHNEFYKSRFTTGVQEDPTDHPLRHVGKVDLTKPKVKTVDGEVTVGLNVDCFTQACKIRIEVYGEPDLQSKDNTYCKKGSNIRIIGSRGKGMYNL